MATPGDYDELGRTWRRGADGQHERRGHGDLEEPAVVV